MVDIAVVVLSWAVKACDLACNPNATSLHLDAGRTVQNRHFSKFHRKLHLYQNSQSPHISSQFLQPLSKVSASYDRGKKPLSLERLLTIRRLWRLSRPTPTIPKARRKLEWARRSRRPRREPTEQISRSKRSTVQRIQTRHSLAMHLNSSRAAHP